MSNVESIRNQRAALMAEKRKEENGGEVVQHPSENDKTSDSVDAKRLNLLQATVDKQKEFISALKAENTALKQTVSELEAKLKEAANTPSQDNHRSVYSLEDLGGAWFAVLADGKPYIDADGEPMKIQGKDKAEAKLAELNGG